jgi:hypothetical protein
MRHLLFLFTLFISFTAFSQGTIKGTLKDTAEGRNLKHTVVSLLTKKDSLLVQFSRAGENGSFELKNVKPGNYIILLSYPGYVDYSDTVDMTTGAAPDLGTVFMTPKAKMLEMAVVRQKIAAIRWKGDTLVFKADSFQVKDDATVEDLLKKFPGFQVDRNGRITAMGEKIEKVLVDGEEFFGDDPTIATRNLDARAVNEVEMFDKKSDQAAFSGVDDGKTVKTLNLKLKEDRKKGYFAKLQAGSNGKELWDNSAMLNAFKGKRKFSAYGIMSKTGKTGLDFGEMMNYGSSGGVESGVSDGGGMFISINDNDDFEWGGGEINGFPKSWTGGVNYSNKWNNDKMSFSGNYKFKKVNTPSRNAVRQQYLLPDTSYYINNTNNRFNSNTTQKAGFNSSLQIDSFTTLKLNFTGSMASFLNTQQGTNESLDGKLAFINDNSRSLTDKGTNDNMRANALLMHKFRKNRRTMSLNIGINNRKQESEGFLYALTRFYDGAGSINRRDTLDQKRVNRSSGNGFNTRLTYTEPLGRNNQLSISYGYERERSASKRSSFDKKDGKYEQLNAVNSNDFDLLNNTHTIGTSISGKIKKFSYNAGNSLLLQQQLRTDVKNNRSNRFNFVNFNPDAYMSYSFNKQTRFSLYANGNTTQPSPDQLQPNQDNTDPLYIVIGNQALKPSFATNGSIRFSKYITEYERSMGMSLDFNNTGNAILSKETFDAQGRRIAQFVNIKSGNHGYRLNLYYNSKFNKKKPWYYGVNMSGGNQKSTNFINALSNTSNNRTYTFGANIGCYVDDKWNMSVNSSFTRNQNRSTTGISIPDYWTYNISADASVDLPLKLSIYTNIDYNYRQQTSANDATNNIAYWTAGITKKFKKAKAYKLQFSVNDILNQNVGFQRSVTPNGIRESTSDTFRRYYMLRFFVNLAKNGKPVDW